MIKTIFSFILFSLLIINSTVAIADKYAYLPDQAGSGSSKSVIVVNTTRGVLVDKVPVFGIPRDIVVSNKGDFAFVSSVLNDTESFINVINTSTIDRPKFFSLSGTNSRGLLLTKDDSTLYITHEEGISKIEDPNISHSESNVDLSFSGTMLVLSNDESILFVIGIGANNEEGVSIIDTSTFEEVTSHSFGTNVAASAAVYDNTREKLYVTYKAENKVVSFKIDKNTNPTSIIVNEDETHKYSNTSSPIDLALNADDSELYVALSYIDKNGNAGNDNGYISIIDPTIFSRVRPGNWSQINLSSEDVEYRQGSAIHPLAISISPDGELHITKQIWGNKGGYFMVRIGDEIDEESGERQLFEATSVFLGDKVSTQAIGQFVGPDCSDCPSGIETQQLPVERPASINHFFLFLILLLLLNRNIVNQKF